MPKHKPIPKPMLITLGVTVMTTVASWAFAFVSHLNGRPKPYTWPYYTSPFIAGLPHGDRFADLTMFAPRFQAFHTDDFFLLHTATPFTYPAPMALFYRIFLPTFSHPAAAFLIFAALCIVMLCALLGRKLIQLGLSGRSAYGYLAGTVAFSSVLAFEANRLNLEFIVFLFIAGYLFAFLQRKFQIAGCLLGVAIALKWFPFILLGLLFNAKKYRAILVSLITAIAVTGIGFAAETPSIHRSYRGTRFGLQHFANEYLFSKHQAFAWDHSLFAEIRRVLIVFSPQFSPQRAYQIYMLAMIVAGLFLFFARIRRVPTFNQVSSLLLLSIFLPPVSYEYTLLHAYSAFAIFCCFAARRQLRGEAYPRGFSAMAACYGILFGLVGFCVWNGSAFYGQAKGLCILLLLVLMLRYSVPDETLDRAEAA